MIPGNRSRGTERSKTKVEKANPRTWIKLVTSVDRGLKPARTFCGVVQDVSQSGPAEVWERKFLSGRVDNLHPSHGPHASK